MKNQIPINIFSVCRVLRKQQPLLVVQVTSSLLPAGEDNSRLLSANLASFAFNSVPPQGYFLSKLMRSLASFFTQSRFLGKTRQSDCAENTFPVTRCLLQRCLIVETMIIWSSRYMGKIIYICDLLLVKLQGVILKALADWCQISFRWPLFWSTFLSTSTTKENKPRMKYQIMPVNVMLN